MEREVVPSRIVACLKFAWTVTAFYQDLADESVLYFPLNSLVVFVESFFCHAVEQRPGITRAVTPR